MRAARQLAALGAAVIVTAILAVSPAAQGSSGPDHFVATAIDQGGATGRSGTAQVDIVISKWTPEVERGRLLEALRKSPDELLKALQKEPAVGRISTPGSLAYDLRYARQTPGQDGGRQIVLATDRPIGFWEAQSGSRTLDYPVTRIELHVDKDGHGEGKLAIAVKPTLNENVLVLEDYAQLPVMLTNVHRAK
ncbi:MAG: hypothetical protein ABI818_00765 [Acidobacteriota bacterium]